MSVNDHSSASAYEAVGPAPSAGTIGLTMNYEWEPVMDGQAPYRFPNPPSEYLRNNYRAPAIYRWRLPGSAGKPDRYYIGETACLAKRVRNYMHPGNRPTAKRINRSLTDCLAVGTVPELQCLRFDAIQLAGQRLRHDGLANKLTRVFVEHLLISVHMVHGCRLLNAKAPVDETEA